MADEKEELELKLNENVSLKLPSLYDTLESTEWPKYEDLVVDEEVLTGPITTVTMADFRCAVLQRQRGRHWACYPTAMRRTIRSLVDCQSEANETPLLPPQRKRGPHDSLKRKKRNDSKKEESVESDDSDKSSKKAKLRLNKVLMEWEGMDFVKASPKQWRALKRAAESHLGIREKLLDAAMRRNWATIIKRELNRGYRSKQTAEKRRLQDARRLAECCKKEVRNDAARNEREALKSAQGMKRMVREMLTLWKKVDRQNADMKKQAEKAAAEQMKRDEEEREKKRQTQRLNFLLSQTELYTHFMSKKLGLPSKCVNHAPSEGKQNSRMRIDDSVLDASLWEEAKALAEDAVERTFNQAQEFDAMVTRTQPTEPETSNGQPSDSLTHPSSMPMRSSVQQPQNFRGTLKSYQLKGLQWLVNLYEQGLNGILADEMGLGKTIQAIAFLGHLAEEKSIWGPYLIIAPASTLHNWDNELKQFYPNLKVLPYWGHCSDRRILRQCFNPRKLYSYHAPFHVAVTSYQILVQDETYLKKVKWQYLILDEAQV